MSERKLRIIKDFLGSFYKSNEEFLFHCPKCKHHKRKLSVNFDKNVFKCWICDYIGKDISRLVYKYGNANNKSEWREVAGVIDFSQINKTEKEKPTVNLPNEFLTLTGKKANPLSIEARHYLKKRRIDKYDIAWWKIGYCPDGDYGQRIIVPSFDLEGDVNYFIARSYGKDEWQKYKNPPAEKDFIFNELYIDWSKDITIVEGIFDAFVATNAIPLLGSTLRENSYILNRISAKCDKVYIALDDDAFLKEEKICRLLREYDVEPLKVDISGYSDVGEMTKEEFQTRKNSAVFASNDYYLQQKLLSI